MKKNVKSLCVSFLFPMGLVFHANAWVQEAGLVEDPYKAQAQADSANLNDVLAPWNQILAPHLEWILANDTAALKAAEIELDEKQIRSRNALQADFSSSFSSGKTLAFDKFTLANPGTDSQEILEAGVSLRKVLWDGGVESLDVENLNWVQKQTVLAVEAKKQAARQGFVKALFEIWGLDQKIALRKQAIAETETLLKMVQRKAASGVSSRRDVQETESELKRQKVAVSELELEREDALLTLKSNWHIRDLDAPRLTPEALQGLFSALQTDGKKRVQDSVSSFSLAVQNSSQVAIKSLQLQVVEAEHRRDSRKVIAPRLEGAAQVDARSRDLIQGSSASASGALQPDWSLSPSVRMTLTVPLWNPSATAVSELTAHKMKVAERERTNTVERCKTKWKQLLQDFSTAEKKVLFQKDVLKDTEDLYKTRNRLFEAGELDVFQMVSTRQELNQRRESVLMQELSWQKHLMESSLLTLWGLSDE